MFNNYLLFKRISFKLKNFQSFPEFRFVSEQTPGRGLLTPFTLEGLQY